MFFRLKGAHIRFSHVYVQCEMSFLLQLRRYTLLLKVWQLSMPQIYKHFFMDFDHDTSFRSILEDDSISSSFRAYICSCSSKGVGLQLVIKPFICLFHIAHFTFTSTLHFCFGLIQPSTFSLFTCQCGHELDTFGMHFTHCPFGGQRITTHDAI